MPTTTQLRLYTIRQGSLRQFAEEWRAQVLPLRLVQGFRVEGAWLVEETSLFAWLLSHDGPEGWDVADRAYYDSPARKAMDPDPARLIERAEERFVKAVI